MVDFESQVQETIDQLRLNKNFYRPDEVAKKLNISTRSVYDLVYNGELLVQNVTPGRRGMKILSSSIRSYVQRTIVPPEFWLR